MSALLCQLALMTSLNGASALTQALTWVAVIDQINEPWLSLVGEDGRIKEVHRAQCVGELREGMWVRYHQRTGRVTLLKTRAERRYALEVERELRERLLRLTYEPEP